MRFLLLFLIWLNPALWAMTADDLAIEATVEFSPAATLSPQQVEQDLAYLRFAVKDGYAGPAQQLLPLLKGLQATDSTSLCQRLSETFMQIRDTHLKAFLDFENCGPSLETGHVGANLNTTGLPWTAEIRNSSKGPVTILAIAHFASSDDPEWNGFLAEVTRLRQQNAPFVIDLRGNTGGDDDNGFEMARILYALRRETVVPTPLKYMKYNLSRTSLALQMSGWSYQIAQMARRGVAVPAYFYKLQETWRKWLQHAKHSPYPSPYVSRIKQTKVNPNSVFAQNLYVLVDRVCASACETTLQALEGLPHRILVGENTLGALEYGAVGMAILPNSHIAVQLATVSNHFRDHRHPEYIGYSPDVRAPEGGDALQTALDQIALEP